MTAATKQDWIRDLKALAETNYNDSYGWQVFVECYDDADWLELIDNCATWEDAKSFATTIADIHTDRRHSL